MPYVGHNVYGPEPSDYAVRTGIPLDGPLSDVWCEPCWWAEFDPPLNGSLNWGSIHGPLGFRWWPAKMAGAVKCRRCGLDYTDATEGDRIETEFRESRY